MATLLLVQTIYITLEKFIYAYIKHRLPLYSGTNQGK